MLCWGNWTETPWASNPLVSSGLSWLSVATMCSVKSVVKGHQRWSLFVEPPSTALALNELETDVRDSVQSMMINTLPKNSYSTKKFILYQKIQTLPKNSDFTENFVLYQKIRTPDEQVLYQKNHTLLFSYLTKKIRTLPENSYFTENFVLYQKIRTPDEQVLILLT